MLNAVAGIIPGHDRGTTKSSTLVLCMFYVPFRSRFVNFRKIMFIDIFWCPHEDSNHEPTDYKSVRPKIYLSIT